MLILNSSIRSNAEMLVMLSEMICDMIEIADPMNQAKRENRVFWDFGLITIQLIKCRSQMCSLFNVIRKMNR